MPSLPPLAPGDIEQMEIATLGIEEILFRCAHYTATERTLIKLQRLLELERQNLAKTPVRREAKQTLGRRA
jgi:hypothetical protein